MYYEPATAGRRAAAVAIDTLPAVALLFLAVRLDYVGLIFSAWMLYYIISSILGQSLGKRILGLRIVRAYTCERIRWYRGLLRFLGLCLNGLPLLPWINLAMILARGDHRTVHDSLAGTLVVDLARPVPEGDKEDWHPELDTLRLG